MNNNVIDIFLIQQYLDGQLDPGQMHELEKQALEDPFLADALDGYIQTGKPVNSQLSILQRQLENRITLQQEEKNVFHFTWQRLSIAAAAGLMFISAGILFWMNSQKENKLIAKSAKPNTEISPAAKDKVAVAQPDSIEFPLAGKDQVVISRPVISRPKRTSVKSAPDILPAIQDDLQPLADNESTTAPGLSEVAIFGKKQSSQQIDAYGAPSSKAAVEVKDLVLSQKTLAGKVISKSDGQPLPDVSIRVRGSSVATSTNDKGEFSLPDSVKGTLDVQHIGFIAKQVNVNPGDKPVIVLEDTKSLSEVIIGGRAAPNSQKEVALSGYVGAMPEAGWEKYNDYLKKSLRYPKSGLEKAGKVTVNFAVDAKGKLSDFKISRGLNSFCDAEALRVVKRGPNWKPDPSGKPYRASVEVSFEKTSRVN